MNGTNSHTFKNSDNLMNQAKIKTILCSLHVINVVQPFNIQYSRYVFVFFLFQSIEVAGDEHFYTLYNLVVKMQVLSEITGQVFI